MTPLLSLTTDDLTSIALDIIDAETAQLPGPAKHAYVVAAACNRASKSPPPVWVWVLITVLDKLIPLVIDWLKKRYGQEWPDKLKIDLAQGMLPWQNSKPPTP